MMSECEVNTSSHYYRMDCLEEISEKSPHSYNEDYCRGFHSRAFHICDGIESANIQELAEDENPDGLCVAKRPVGFLSVRKRNAGVSLNSVPASLVQAEETRRSFEYYGVDCLEEKISGRNSNRIGSYYEMSGCFRETGNTNKIQVAKISEMGGYSKDKYYANFSKFALTQKNEPIKPKEFSYLEWKSSSQDIERISLQSLKQTLKSNSLPVYGNKSVLINRLVNQYNRIQCTIHIQRAFRGFLVRESERLRGPAAKILSICNNETDFETMNPLNEIPREHFFSYQDENGFVYGFNLFSLMSIFKRTRRLVNPYNREDVPFASLQDLFSLYKKVLILYPEMTP